MYVFLIPVISKIFLLQLQILKLYAQNILFQVVFISSFIDSIRYILHWELGFIDIQKLMKEYWCNFTDR